MAPGLIWFFLSCVPKSVPIAPPPKPLPISYGVTFSIDDSASFNPELLLEFKSQFVQELTRSNWELVSLNIDPYTDVFSIEHEQLPIEGSSVLAIPDVQIHLYYSKSTNIIFVSLEFVHQRWQTQVRVELDSLSIQEQAQKTIQSLVEHVDQAQMDGKIPYGVSIFLSMAPQEDLSHHDAERYRYLKWTGLIERLWASGIPQNMETPLGNPSLSVINTTELDPHSFLNTLELMGVDCRNVGRSRTTLRLHCALPEVDSGCVSKTTQWMLASKEIFDSQLVQVDASSQTNPNVLCLDGDCQSLNCDEQYCCLSLNFDNDPTQSALCKRVDDGLWFLGTDDCQP